MNEPRLWLSPESDLDRALAAEPDALVVSFGSPTRTTPRPARVPTDRFVAFSFNDIAERRTGLVAPGPEDAARMRRVIAETDAAAIVFQCWFGVSRSAAAALLGLSLRWQAAPEAAVATLRRAAPWSTPNPLLAALVDAELGLGGRLERAVRAAGRGVDAVGVEAVQLRREARA